MITIFSINCFIEEKKLSSDQRIDKVQQEINNKKRSNKNSQNKTKYGAVFFYLYFYFQAVIN
jgi:hypothetical protein